MGVVGEEGDRKRGGKGGREGVLVWGIGAGGGGVRKIVEKSC